MTNQPYRTEGAYTPSVDEVRGVWTRHVDAADNAPYRKVGWEPLSLAEIRAEFDRMIEAVRAEAWDEGKNAVYAHDRSTPFPTNPHRAQGKEQGA